MHCRGGASLLCVVGEEYPYQLQGRSILVMCCRGGVSLLCVVGVEHPCYVL